MFTGIIESLGKITQIEEDQTNRHFTIASSLAKDCYIDQSIAHNGVCLTVVKKTAEDYVVTAIKESLDRSNLGNLEINDFVNLERAMLPDTRMDGHMVQGHVDGIAECVSINDVDGSWEFGFKINPKDTPLIVDKGSVTINGTSLTVCNPEKNQFEVCIIPFTYEHTNFNSLKIGDQVNIEFDIIGKYVARYMEKIGK
jgi:riboflavin synthase